MTIAELPPATHPEVMMDPNKSDNPYGMDIGSEYAKGLMNQLISTVSPYADGDTNPDLGSKSLFVLDGHEPGTDLARMLEADVLKNDSKWGQSPEQTSQELSAIEDNSKFFILVDKTSDGPKLVGSLRIADLRKGPSESKAFYLSENKVELSLPNDIDHNAIWDIVYVVVHPEYQDGKNSAWLYWAMHDVSEKSLKAGGEDAVEGWIANIHEEEYRLLSMLGIPFKEIPNTTRIEVPSKINPNKKHLYGFYYTELDIVASSVEATARKLLPKSGSSRFLGQLACIAKFGSEHLPEEQKAA